MKRLFYILPLAAFLVIGVYLAIGLTLDPQKLPNMLEGKPVPAFNLAGLEGRDEKGFANTDLRGEVSLVNVFGSWCVACRVEHPFLMKIKENGWVPIHGIDWREPNRTAGPQWLRRHGDPYTLAGDDPKSKAAIAFGVTGAPETFVVDKQGIIRYKHVGPIDEKVWSGTLNPLIEHLRGQGE
ncbi:MAG: DsbE family thiol:disulfide interchange protein [Rhodospirillales bacterium]|nr:DsbE family thiol:disulfide interchange protein [Rhodospirillales bacterium]MBO6788174.1 DsbE family thiol:disulfide interchange protein [Rhodospirillales bacterium]